MPKNRPDSKVRRRGMLGDMLFVIKRERKWWILPLIGILLVIIGLMLLAGSAGPLAPFLYPLL